MRVRERKAAAGSIATKETSHQNVISTHKYAHVRIQCAHARMRAADIAVGLSCNCQLPRAPPFSAPSSSVAEVPLSTGRRVVITAPSSKSPPSPPSGVQVSYQLSCHRPPADRAVASCTVRNTSNSHTWRKHHHHHHHHHRHHQHPNSIPPPEAADVPACTNITTTTRATAAPSHTCASHLPQSLIHPSVQLPITVMAGHHHRQPPETTTRHQTISPAGGRLSTKACRTTVTSLPP